MIYGIQLGGGVVSSAFKASAANEQGSDPRNSTMIVWPTRSIRMELIHCQVERHT